MLEAPALHDAPWGGPIMDTRAESASSGQSPNDAKLVAAINGGSHAAFEELYRRHRDWTVNLAAARAPQVS